MPYANENILNGYATEEYVEGLYQNLFSDKVLRFYCVEDVTIILNGVRVIRVCIRCSSHNM